MTNDQINQLLDEAVDASIRGTGTWALIRPLIELDDPMLDAALEAIRQVASASEDVTRYAAQLTHTAKDINERIAEGRHLSTVEVRHLNDAINRRDLASQHARQWRYVWNAVNTEKSEATS